MIELKESLTFRVPEVAEILQTSDDKARKPENRNRSPSPRRKTIQLATRLGS